MIDKDLLEILVCPENHQKLVLLSDAELARVNDRILASDVRDKSGTAITAPLGGGLLREDLLMLYKIVDGIPVLLIDEAIPFGPLEA